jgi:uncharacterized protein (TIGR02231 family)
MRLLFATLLLATTSCTAVYAAEFTPPSKIDAVTVFPQGADIVRELAYDVPAGSHSLILTDLPQNIDAQSIRVEGAGDGQLLVGSVDTRKRYLGDGALDAQRKSIEKNIQTLQVERQSLDQTVADLNQQRTILYSLADKQLVPQSTTDTTKSIDAVQLGALLDVVGERLSNLSKDVTAAQNRQRDIDEKVNELSIKLGELAPNTDSRTEVVVNVEAATGAKGNLRLSYRVQEASWLPFYDARLTIGDGKAKPMLDLVQRAEVTQNTGESWKDVTLVLSTARPSGSTAAPDMVAWEVSKLEPLPKMAQDSLAVPAPVAESEMNLTEGDAGIDYKLRRVAKPASPVMQKQAIIDTAGFQATYAIAGRVTVDNAGQSKKVRITSSQLEATLSVIVVPRVDTTAYLSAAFTMAGTGPQLPGMVNLFRDGVYVGQGTLPLLNPSENTELGFGADDLLKVKRAEVKRVTGEEGLLTSSNVDDRAWDITVKNLHTQAMPVRVVDRVPFTASKDIDISESPAMTPPTIRDLDKKRGVLAWDFTLEPQAENILKTGYKITWPEGMQVSVVE